MKKLILKSILFVAPFAVFAVLEFYVLPVDFWTFRVWEAATNGIGGPVKGPFIPKMHIEKLETGDRRLPNGPTKQVEWFTDKYGYRNRPPLRERYDVVTIGDSNFAGSFLDQKDTFAETLERECRCSVYNHAYQGPGDFRNYLRQIRFDRFPPKLVVYDIRSFDLYDPAGWHGPLPDLPADEDGTTLSSSEIDVLNRKVQYKKQPGLNWMRARLGIAVRGSPSSTLAPRGRSKLNSELASEHGAELAAILASYQSRLQQHGTRFVVFYLESDPELENLLRPYFEQAGVDLVSFARVADPRNAYFQAADSHWSEQGVRAAASVVAAYISKQNIVAQTPR